MTTQRSGSSPWQSAAIAAVAVSMGAAWWLVWQPVACAAAFSQPAASRVQPPDEAQIPDLSAMDMAGLLEALNSDQPGTRYAAVKELGARGAASAGTEEQLGKLLTEDKAPAVRAQAARALAAIGLPAEQALTWLDKAIRDEDYDLSGSPVWFSAAESMGTFGQAALPRIQELLEQGQTQSTRAATAALGKMDSDAVKPLIPRLLEELAKDDDETRLFVIVALGGGAGGADQVVPALVRVLGHRDFHTQYWACSALGRMGRAARSAVPDLIQAMRAGTASVRRHAALALGEIGSDGPQAVAALIDALKDPVEPVRRDALISLGKLAAQALPKIDVLEAALEDRQFSPRAYAAMAVYRITGKKKRALEVLIEELQTTNSVEAVEVLTEIGPDLGAVPEIKKLLLSTEPSTKYFAMEALGELGKAAEEALPDVKRLADDPNEDDQLRQVARETMEAITTGKPRKKAAREDL